MPFSSSHLHVGSLPATQRDVEGVESRACKTLNVVKIFAFMITVNNLLLSVWASVGTVISTTRATSTMAGCWCQALDEDPEVPPENSLTKQEE